MSQPPRRGGLRGPRLLFRAGALHAVRGASHVNTLKRTKKGAGSAAPTDVTFGADFVFGSPNSGISFPYDALADGTSKETDQTAMPFTGARQPSIESTALSGVLGVGGLSYTDPMSNTSWASDGTSGLGGGFDPLEQGFDPTLFRRQSLETIGKYKLDEQAIGQGSFGTVFRATHVDTGEEAAVKSFIQHGDLDASEREQLRAEVEILRCLNHPGIVNMIDVIHDDDGTPLHILMDFYGGGTLDDLIERRSSGLPEEECRDVLSPIAGALRYCHQHCVCHRDLKPLNVLLGSRRPPRRAALCDFGLSLYALPEPDFPRSPSAIPADGLSRHVAKTWLVGSENYTAPEVRPGTMKQRRQSLGATLRSGLAPSTPISTPAGGRRVSVSAACRYDPFPADVWSLGSILAAMLTGRPTAAGLPASPRAGSAAALAARMLGGDPQARPTMVGVCADPFLRTRGTGA